MDRDQLIASLLLPESREVFSPLTGQAWCLLDFSENPISAGQHGILLAQLPLLPCPTIAITSRRMENQAADLLAQFDVIVRTRAEADSVINGIKKQPLAASTLVQLLRHHENSSLHDALLAESLAYATLQSGQAFAQWLKNWRQTQQDVASAPQTEPAVVMQRQGSMGNTLAITLNRPAQRNAYSTAMRDGLYEALSLLDLDRTLEHCVIDGAGECFSIGGDLHEFGHADDVVSAHLLRSTRNVAHLLLKHAEKICFKVHRACIGSGIELPAFAHHIVAQRSTFFQLPELSMGLIPGAGGTVSIMQRIGRQRLNWWVLSGKKINTDIALQWGLIDEIV